MKITTTVLSAVAAVGIAVSVATAPTASAYSTVGKFGSYEKLYDAGGAVVTAWTVNNLKPSTDTIADYPLAGKLWEATATIKAVRGTVTPPHPQSQRPSRRRPQLPSPLGRLYPAGIRSHHRPRPKVHRQDLLRRHRRSTLQGHVQQRRPGPAHLGKVKRPSRYRQPKPASDRNRRTSPIIWRTRQLALARNQLGNAL